MDFAQTQEQQMIQIWQRIFAENEIKPYVDEDEKNQHWRREIFEKMAHWVSLVSVSTRNTAATAWDFSRGAW